MKTTTVALRRFTLILWRHLSAIVMISELSHSIIFIAKNKNHQYVCGVRESVEKQRIPLEPSETQEQNRLHNSISWCHISMRGHNNFSRYIKLYQNFNFKIFWDLHLKIRPCVYVCPINTTSCSKICYLTHLCAKNGLHTYCAVVPPLPLSACVVR